MRKALLALLCALVAATAGYGAVVQKPLKFIDPVTSVTALHPTSGLAGFPARDYLAPGHTLVRAPFNGCVPRDRPYGWLAYQNPDHGFGGARVYLRHNKTGRQAYLAHFGNPAFGGIFVKPGECFWQGDPLGHVWLWPGNPGRSHIHMGWQGGDPLFLLVDRHGNFLLREIAKNAPAEQKFPRAFLRYEGKWWRVYVGKKRVYQGGKAKAEQVYNNQKLARTINLHFKNTYVDSPLVGWGLPMVRFNRARNVDPRLPAAIASCETSGGTRGAGPLVNNDFGLLVNGGAHREFKSRKQAIQYLAKLLDEKYVSKGLDTIVEIGAKYAPLAAGNDPGGKNSRWVDCVTNVYLKLHGTRFITALPKLEKIETARKTKGCADAGRWRVTRAGALVFQCIYKPAVEVYRDKLAWALRKNGMEAIPA